VLHEMLTGQRLFDGPTAYAVFERQVKELPPPVPGIPKQLNGLLAETLAKDPEARPPGAAVLYDRLGPFVTGLPPLPGFLAPPSVASPGRMYARMLGRVSG